MSKEKKQVLIIISLLIMFIVIIILLFNNINRDDKPENKNPNNPDNSTFNTKINRLNEENIFFTIQKNINDFYMAIVTQDKNKVYNYLTENYITTNNITLANVLDKFPSNYVETSYVAKEIYYNPNSNITYYFVNGYFTNKDLLDDDTLYQKDINYLVIVDNNNNLVLEPLNITTSISTYARSYPLKEITLSHSNKISNSSISEKNKLIIYLSEFYNNLIINDPNRAYDMLEKNTLYPTLDSFTTSFMNIINKYSTNIFSYSKTEAKDYTTYNIIDNKNNHLTITEYHIMDYKITF